MWTRILEDLYIYSYAVRIHPCIRGWMKNPGNSRNLVSSRLAERGGRDQWFTPCEAPLCWVCFGLLVCWLSFLHEQPKLKAAHEPWNKPPVECTMTVWCLCHNTYPSPERGSRGDFRHSVTFSHTSKNKSAWNFSPSDTAVKNVKY